VTDRESEERDITFDASDSPEETGSFAAFAGGSVGYLLLNLAVAFTSWETAQPTPGRNSTSPDP
jgi:hypothetical protein